MTALPPGPELDLQVARAIGRQLHYLEQGEWYLKYSSDANAALEAYEEMRKRGWRMAKALDILTGEQTFYWRVVLRKPPTGEYITKHAPSAEGFGPTFASALCAAIVEASKR